MSLLQIPKLELHCHLDGSLPFGFVREQLGDSNIMQENLQAPKDCNSLAQYLERFDLPIRCLQSAKGIEEAGYAFIKEVAKENIRYVEVRFAPLFSVHEQLSCRAVIEALLLGLERAKRDFGVYSNVIVCAMRHLTLEQNIEMLRIARELLGAGVCALDLAGDEAAYANSEFRDLFAQARKWEMPFTIHAGECGSASNVREAIDMGAKRVGHGIALMKDPDLRKEFRQRQIGIEMCPTSNLQTKAIEKWESYPIYDFLNNDLKVSVNTDNRTVSGTTMTEELELVCRDRENEEELVHQLLNNAVETAFASDDVKHQLSREIKESVQ